MVETHHPPQQDQEPLRKGKSNAILTYELLAEFRENLSVIAERVAATGKDVQDHEVRLRALEAITSVFIASTQQSKTDRTALWAALGTITALAIQSIMLVVALIKLHP